jgi:hypothetical protein
MWVTVIYMGVAGKKISSSLLQRNYNKNTSIHDIKMLLANLYLETLLCCDLKKKSNAVYSTERPF